MVSDPSGLVPPDLDDVRELLRPPGPLDLRIREFLDQALGRVLPRSPQRGLGRYLDEVVLGGRALEAFSVLRRHRASGTAKPVLDVGSGLGSFVLLANSLGMPAVGIEPSLAELNLATERARALLPTAGTLFAAAKGESLPIEDGAVSAVVAHDVLEHVDDWRAVLHECHRVLTDGGVLYVKGPSYAVRFVEPHYRLPWLPSLPRPLARRYLALLGRDLGYLESIGFRRRGETLDELRRLGFLLTFPRLDKLADPSTVNRTWARKLVTPLAGPGLLGRLGRLAAENQLQSVIDVVARRHTDSQ